MTARRTPVPLDLDAPVRHVRRLSGKSHQALALASGYTPGRTGRGNAGSIQAIEASGPGVAVASVTRVARGAGVALTAHARYPGGAWSELALATIADAPVSVAAVRAVAAWLGVDLRIEAALEEPGTPLADAALGALAAQAEEAGKPVMAHVVREVLASGRAKSGQQRGG